MVKGRQDIKLINLLTEINILWAFHQAHHSSEHFNLTTALRQSIFQVYFHCVCLPQTLHFVNPN